MGVMNAGTVRSCELVELCAVVDIDKRLHPNRVRALCHLRSASVRRALAEKEATMRASAQEACVASTTTPPNLRNCPRDASSPVYTFTYIHMCV